MNGRIRCPICHTRHLLHIDRLAITDTLDHITFECPTCWRDVTTPATPDQIARLATLDAAINIPTPDDPRTLA